MNSVDSATVPSRRSRVYQVINADEFERIHRFRYQIFVQEQRKYLNSADHVGRRLTDPLDDVAVHLALEQDGEVIASLRQARGLRHATSAMHQNFSLEAFAGFPDAAFGFSGRLSVKNEHRGSRALLNLLLTSYNGGRDAGVIFDFIISDPHLVRFYEQMGYRRYRPFYYDAVLGLQTPLVLVADDAEHLQRVGSVFARASRKWPSRPEHSRRLAEAFPAHREFISPATLSADQFIALLSSKVAEKTISLLEGFSSQEIDDLLRFATHFQLEPGSRIVRRGYIGQELYLILDGVAKVSGAQRDDSERTSITTLHMGDIFGETSVLTGRPCSFDVVAVTELELIFVDKVTLTRLIKGKPEIAARLLFNLSRVLAERLESS